MRSRGVRLWYHGRPTRQLESVSYNHTITEEL